MLLKPFKVTDNQLLRNVSPLAMVDSKVDKIHCFFYDFYLASEGRFLDTEKLFTFRAVVRGWLSQKGVYE